MIINDQSGHDSILSEEGSTQGDVPAMGMYALGTKPLIDNLHDTVNHEKCKQGWYADDSSSCGEILEMKKWWDKLIEIGPKYGYHPKASKTILIVKSYELLEHAQDVFGDTGVTIDVNGERHLGAVIGSQHFKETYVTKKVDKWVQDVEQLAEIGKDEPQLALTGYTKALCMRWSFVQRTISGIEDLFQPLEDAIREKLIPAVVGRKVSDLERRILALPVRYGGIGLLNPVETAEIEYETSVATTENLTEIIYNQERNFDNLDETKAKSRRAEIK